jgi:hypothetical protein
VNSYEATRLAKLVRRPNGEALPSATKLVLVAYCEYVGPRNGLTVYPSAARIADDLGGVSERTVQRHRARLREWELIEATPRMRSEGRGRTSDATHLTFLEDQPDWRDRVSQDQPDTFDDQPGNSGRSTRHIGHDQAEGIRQGKRQEKTPEQEDKREGSARASRASFLENSNVNGRPPPLSDCILHSLEPVEPEECTCEKPRRRRFRGREGKPRWSDRCWTCGRLLTAPAPTASVEQKGAGS